MPHPKDIPLNDWTPGWLKLETASLLDNPRFILMRDDEKSAAGYPISPDEMRAFIRNRRS